MPTDVYIGAGSNLDNRFKNLKAAWLGVQDFLEKPDFSSLWETAPLIVEDQPKFLNMVFRGVYRGSSMSLLERLQSLETSYGRDRSKEVPKGPRTLDLDILLFGRMTVHTDLLVLPHPEILNRSFVLTPLLEIYPEDSISADQYRQSLNGLSDQDIICRRKRTISNFWDLGEPDEQ